MLWRKANEWKMLWRKANEEFKLKNLKPTMTYDGGSLMVWDCISSKGRMSELVFIDGILHKNKYLSILKDNLIKSNNMNIRGNFKFYQDNDPKHKSRIMQEYLLYNCLKVLHPPPHNHQILIFSIENLWNFFVTWNLDRNIRIMPTRSKEELKLRLKEENTIKRGHALHQII